MVETNTEITTDLQTPENLLLIFEARSFRERAVLYIPLDFEFSRMLGGISSQMSNSRGKENVSVHPFTMFASSEPL
jgi:hypothetical protein